MWIANAYAPHSIYICPHINNGSQQDPDHISIKQAVNISHTENRHHAGQAVVANHNKSFTALKEQVHT